MTNKAILRVIIADDSELVQDQVRSVFSKHDHAKIVAAVGTADSAIEAVDSEDADVVILDIDMPGSGIMALRHIKKGRPQTIVVMFTNHADEYYKRICLKLGADYFLDKSLQFEELPNVLSRIATRGH